jgi:GTP diphosphokinase / guanosine-3',5'-bis(diphosphate) 3'-diphosphatase
MSSPGRSGTLGRRALQAIEGSPMERAREAVPGGIAKVLAAAEFAAFKHREQRRKGVRGSPYINHPLAVASTLATDVDVLAAAILHDTIEDTDTTEAELERAFGPEVASIVVEVTDEKTQSKALRKRMQIAHAPHLSAQAKLVKLADKIVNLRDIVARPPNWDLKRKQEYFDWAKQVVDGLRGVHPELEAEFDRVHALRPR